MSKLFGEDSDSDPEDKLTTNKEYAKSFNQLRQKEMLQKFKDKRLSDLDSEDLTSSSSEDDDEPFNPEFTKTFLKTLASLKSHDPKIYDKSTKFFDDKPLFPETQKKPKKTAMDLKTYERNVLLGTNGKLEDSDDENGRPQSPSIREEENQIKNEFKKILDDESDQEAGWGNMFKKREKSKQELENEEMQYIKWLAGQKSDIGEDAKDLNSLKEFWAKPNLSKDEAFLRDYILNNGYVDDDDTELNNIQNGEKLSDDEEEVERMEEFEYKYNFRFEEPDQEFIKRYPRTIENSVRKQDDRRVQKRIEVKERKEKEKELKLKELQQIKKIKQHEIEEKIRKLKMVTGNDKLAFDDVDFEEDFDPDEHDRKMQQIFDEEYYQVEESGEKPECPDIEELAVENWDNYDPTKDDEDYGYDECEAPHCEDDNFNMDADYKPSAEERRKDLEDELIENTKDNRKRRKRRNKFMEMIKKEKPVFDPEDEKTYGEYIDEYYKLDYEDIIGDQPCRFKYVETVPNNFGLSTEEIFLATNKELNTWASLKKAVQHRPDYLERQDVKMYQQRAANLELKKKIFKSIYGEEAEKSESEEDTTTNSQPSEPKKKKKRNRKRKASEAPTSNDTTNKFIKVKVDTELKNTVSSNILKFKSEQSTSAIQTISSDKEAATEKPALKESPAQKKPFLKLFRKSKVQKTKLGAKNISDNRLRAFGINPSKFHYQQKMANKQQTTKSNLKQKKKIVKRTLA